MDLFALRHVPFMARRNYLIEAQHMLLWGVFAGIFEGTVSSVVVAKTFHAGPYIIALVMATPQCANLLGLLWGSLATGRRKMPLFAAFALCSAAVLGSIAFTPSNEWGAYIFTAQIAIARAFLSGCITVRASLWKHNYPSASRGRITARLQMVRFSIGIGTVFLVSMLFDIDPMIYVYVYPAAAFIGGIAILALRRTHVRGEQEELKDIAEQVADKKREQGGERPWFERLFSPLQQMVDVLRSDRRFAQYCLAMMFLGFGNIMVRPLMVIIITKQLYLSYWHSCNLTEVLPRVLAMGSMMLWAGLFDRVGVIRFRVVNAYLWTGGAVLCGVSAWIIAMWGIDTVAAFACAVACMALARTSHGFAEGGGAIAWNIGHLHFADSTRAEAYMGTHVFLTGIRGLLAPLLGAWLLERFNAPFALVVASASSFAGLFVFILMSRKEPRERAEHAK